MPSYKLSYFDVRGRGELSRLVLVAAGQKFEDNRVTDWPSMKASTPFGQLPVLEVDGKQLAQSNSIARFLAREFNLAGKTSFEQALCDQYLELVEDLFKELVKAFFEKDEAKKAELLKNQNEVVLPKFLDLFEKSLEANGGQYLVGTGLSLADLAVYNGFDTPLQNMPEVMDKYPKMKALRATIEAVPSVGTYIKNRKRTDI